MGDQLPFLFDDERTNDDEPSFVTSNDPLSVAQITHYIKDRFDRDVLLKNVSIEGEISNLTRAASGHIYFSLKDSDAQLKAVMWRSSATKLSFDPNHGDRVVARGQISVYEPRGEYQLYAKSMHPAGVGDLHAAFERLKLKLSAEGLFEPERKQPLPYFPRKIGVITSPKAAALQDVLNVLRRRFPIAEVVFSPTLVQGDDAPPHIIRALEGFFFRDDIDVILLVRGGGSLEDLWAFNDEDVVRMVAACPIPIVTGVGHEIDFTLVDFASDHRAPTPSAAAEVATPEADMLRMNVDALQQALMNYMQDNLVTQRQQLDIQTRTLKLLSPAHDIKIQQRQVEQYQQRLAQVMRSHIQQQQNNLAAKTAALHAANPESILARGYSIVTNQAGEVISNSDAAPAGSTINIQLHQGSIQATVDESK